MFNKDVTATYNQQDATLEIIIMLAVAFLLGYLLSWILRKPVSEKHEAGTRSSIYSEGSMAGVTNLVPASPQTNSARKGRARTATADSGLTYRTPKIDDLTKISGIDQKTVALLKEDNINSFTDLRDIKREDLKDIQETKKYAIKNKKEVETWPHQASLAAKGDWKRLTDYQSFINRSQRTGDEKKQDADDLKTIEGIGPRIEEILNSKGIHTFEDLRKADSVLLKNYIVAADKRFEKNETESWPHQAGMAEKGQWEELKIYQEFMHADSELPIESSEDVITTSPPLIDEHDNQSDHDDLQKIAGIDTDVEVILNSSGIYTFSQLYNSNRNRLSKLIETSDKKIANKLIESWPHQAGMADRKEWGELRTYQQLLTMENIKEASDASSDDGIPTANNVINKVDDLKKIEGIGPKIEQVLNDAGINSFKKLKDASRDSIKNLLDNAGPQYRMHEPESWPYQAKLAYNGDWDKLRQYQEKLISGRE